MEGSVAKKIRNFRNIKGITQGELARETDLSRNTIVNFETERRDPRVRDEFKERPHINEFMDVFKSVYNAKKLTKEILSTINTTPPA